MGAWDSTPEAVGRLAVQTAELVVVAQATLEALRAVRAPALFLAGLINIGLGLRSGHT